MTKENLLYVEDKVLRYCSWASEILAQFRSVEEYLRFIKTWIIWNDQHNFIHLFGNPPTGCVIWRPAPGFVFELADLTFFDLRGEYLWVDFLWAPHQWPAVCAWLLSTGKLYGGWQRRENFKVHTVEIKSLVSHHKHLGNRSRSSNGNHGAPGQDR